jgi:hypothetical protein
MAPVDEASWRSDSGSSGVDRGGGCGLRPQVPCLARRCGHAGATHEIVVRSFDRKGTCGGHLVRILGTAAYSYVCIYDPTTKQLEGLRFLTDTPDRDSSCSGAGTTVPKACNNPSTAFTDAGTGG